MSASHTLLVIGGTSGIGHEIAERAVRRGDNVLITGRDASSTDAVAKRLGCGARGLPLDLSRPDEIRAALGDIGTVHHLVIAAITRDQNGISNYNIPQATNLVTLKLIGYVEVIHALLPHLPSDSSIVLFGGVSKDRPYVGSTTITTVNGGIAAMVRTLAVELAPIRVNAIHPGIVGDSPFWNPKPPEVLEGYRSRTPTRQLATMSDIADAVEFLLRNPAVNGANLDVNGGMLLT